jgi:hypothetical protein
MREGTGCVWKSAEGAWLLLFVGLLALGIFNLTLNPDFVPTAAAADNGTAPVCATGSSLYICPDPYSTSGTTSVCVDDSSDPPSCDCDPGGAVADDPAP